MKKKLLIKVPKIKKPKLPSSKMDKESLLQMELELKELLNSRGWMRFVSIVENDLLPPLDDKVDNAEFTSLADFNRVRDTRQVFRRVLMIPQTYVTMLAQNGIVIEFDPYDDVPKKKS